MKAASATRAGTTDLQTVLRAIARTAAQVCEANDALIILLMEGDRAAVVARHGLLPIRHKLGETYPLTDDMVSNRSITQRRTIHLRDLGKAPRGRFLGSKAAHLHLGVRTMLVTPLLRDGNAIGAIGVRRMKVQPFTPKQVALLKTFANQAAIAIENVRLFKELEARNRDLSEALDRQTATAEILRVISSSPTDVQPVFDAIVESAARLCASRFAILHRVEGDLIHLVAHRNLTPEELAAIRRVYPAPVSSATLTGRAIVERAVVHIHDIRTDPSVPPAGREIAGVMNHRSIVYVPMLAEGRSVGTINVGRDTLFSDAEIALLQTFADQAVIAIENARLFTETKEALEQQTATSEILRVISSSPTDTQPVFDTIAANAARLCVARDAQVLRVEGDVLRLVSAYGSPSMPPVRTISRGHAVGRAIIDRQTIHVRDMAQAVAEFPETSSPQHGVESLLAVPLLHEDVAVGVIRVSRTQIQPFTVQQIALLKTFADQAVIAIENVRLFTELQEKNRALTTAHAQVSEALEQQTATSEVLRVISSSPTDIQPVLNTVAASSARLCEAQDTHIYLVDGDVLRLAAHHGPLPSGVVGESTLPLIRGTLNGRAVIERHVAQIADLQNEVREFPEGAATARRYGHRTALIVPLLREGVAIGTISLRRAEVRLFSERQVALLQTFADQAVIAIENVRLFTELQEKNLALTDAHAQVTEALDRQTATADILRAISQAQTDVQPVFEAIADSTIRLFCAWSATVYQYDGELMSLAAARGGLPGSSDSMVARLQAPHRPNEGALPGLAVLTRTVQHVADVEADPAWGPDLRRIAGERGFRSNLAVPMLRGTEAVGAIDVTREQPGGFSPAEVALLQTFADQAVIAVENARLLAELQARTADLTRSVNQLTALGEVSRALSSTLDLETVLNTIVARASELAGTNACTVYEYDDATGEFHWRPSANPDEEVEAVARRTTIPRGVGAQGRMAVTRAPVQISDIAAEGAYHGPLRDVLLQTGTRAILAVPLLRDDQLVGGLTVNRKTPGEFTPEVVELLKTFATQSALAIQNARLFREIADKSRQVETASQHKSEFLANMSHELRTPLNAIIGFSEVLTERMFGELNEKQEEYLKDIYASGTHLLSLINDILDLSKIEAGRMELELTDFDLPQAIDNALILVRERATRRGIGLEHSMDERLGEIRADERKVKQVLLNLLSNALKFTPEGGRVEVRAGLVDGVAEISVTDTGVGIAPEDQGAIFEEFRQVGTAEKKAEGTGLGLTLCRKFVELHGGRIWVTSQVGVGSTFTFRLPVRCGE